MLGVRYRKGHVSRLLKAPGWTPQVPIKRAIQREIENPFGRLLLEGKVRDGQIIVVDYDASSDRLTFTPQSS